jgi:hypothetical protein
VYREHELVSAAAHVCAACVGWRCAGGGGRKGVCTPHFAIYAPLCFSSFFSTIFSDLFSNFSFSSPQKRLVFFIMRMNCGRSGTARRARVAAHNTQNTKVSHKRGWHIRRMPATAHAHA